MDQRPVLEFLHGAAAGGGRCVLVAVGAVEGSSMRAPGTIMGIAEDGSYEGSLSGGCIEAAVVAEAFDVLAAGKPRVVRFGAGSPYLDIKLPCGGGLDLAFHPLRHWDAVERALASIAVRQPFSLVASESGLTHEECWQPPHFEPDSPAFAFGYFPAPLLQIAGHGAAVEQLVLLGRTYGCDARVITPDAEIARRLGRRDVPAALIERTGQTDLLGGDPWTATILLFHDHDWEIDLIAAALDRPHFYLGAMGGRKAHAFRTEALTARGVSAEAIATIRAPIGLFHSSRDPQTLALSTLAEVVRTYHETDFGKVV
ncbi:XdhC family protein [Erythrobacter sp.]|jgi:xanthine dehydrogenase accessory factor|uniref:XdhC family protein n=1 Tax=Erythrobacter sp. TaxID=1042 RepID=UPI002EB27F9F|nr:XdhC family protein [Erythrobacter sp.]